VCRSIANVSRFVVPEQRFAKTDLALLERFPIHGGRLVGSRARFLLDSEGVAGAFRDRGGCADFRFDLGARRASALARS